MNNVHGEDDVSYWVSGDHERGVVAVADGVSASSGGGASFLAVNAAVYCCRAYMAEYSGVQLARRCLDCVSRVFAEARPGSLDVLELVKKGYYKECGGGGVCSEPLSFESLVEGKAKPRIVLQEVRRESPPATTLFLAILGSSSITFALAGDGYVVGFSGARTEDTWLLWGAMPQFGTGGRLVHFLEAGRGLVGNPLVSEFEVRKGVVYAITTDGVDPTALTEAMLKLLSEHKSLSEVGGNPAARVLEIVLEASPPEDDATIAIVEYTE
jgi:hypothetical protein